MTTFNGKCHCGEIEWTVKLTEQAHVLCHCNACKKLSGSAYTLNQVVPKSDVNVTKGTLKTYSYAGDSGNPTICYFCGTCASSPFHHQTYMGPDKYVVRTILLNGGNAFPPAAELYGRDRLPWVKEVATTFEINPPS